MDPGLITASTASAASKSADPRIARLHQLARLVGRTPLLAISLRLDGQLRTIYAKAETFNLTGSIKDRMALQVLSQALQTGQLPAGALVAEATSGNAGIAITAMATALGHPVKIFMPDWMSPERIALMQLYGAQVELISHAQGGFLGSIARTRELAHAHGCCFLPSQFDNEANALAHERGTAVELLAQLRTRALQPDAFVAGVGTGGTVLGVSRHFGRMCPQARVHPLEPAESPTLSTGHKVGKHRIQGISDEFIPALCRLDQLAPVVAVHDGDAIVLAQRLARELGLGVGVSSGANLLGALKVQQTLGPKAVVCTVLCDDNKKYLSTDLCRTEPLREGYLSPRIELLGFESIDCPAVEPPLPA
jgi:cysteine synthase A